MTLQEALTCYRQAMKQPPGAVTTDAIVRAAAVMAKSIEESLMAYRLGDEVIVDSALAPATIIGMQLDLDKKTRYVLEFPDGYQVLRYREELSGDPWR